MKLRPGPQGYTGDRVIPGTTAQNRSGLGARFCLWSPVPANPPSLPCSSCLSLMRLTGFLGETHTSAATTMPFSPWELSLSPVPVCPCLLSSTSLGASCYFDLTTLPRFPSAPLTVSSPLLSSVSSFCCEIQASPRPAEAGSWSKARRISRGCGWSEAVDPGIENRRERFRLYSAQPSSGCRDCNQLSPRGKKSFEPP